MIILILQGHLNILILLLSFQNGFILINSDYCLFSKIFEVFHVDSSFSAVHLTLGAGRVLKWVDIGVFEKGLG